MLKPLTTTYKGREITLECTHKKIFPPPQMYGHTPEDIDTLWKQGAIDQNQHQHLKVWKEKCGLMVMGPRCLDCPLALKQNPRPGRPHVIETEPWLPAKEKMHWDDMKAGKLAPKPLAEQETPIDPVSVATEEEEPEEESLIEEEEPEEESLIEEEEPEKESLIEEEEPEEEEPEEEEPEEAPGLADDLLDALAED